MTEGRLIAAFAQMGVVPGIGRRARRARRIGRGRRGQRAIRSRPLARLDNQNSRPIIATPVAASHHTHRLSGFLTVLVMSRVP